MSLLFRFCRTASASSLTPCRIWKPHLWACGWGSARAMRAPHEHGSSHLLEHMAFKGTGTRDARAIAEEIEAVGGELNAATGLETTSYFARVLKGDEAVALGLIADILQNSAFAEEELEREREVILQEIAATQDSPDDIVFDMVHDIAFPDQPAGRPIMGTPGSVKSLSASSPASFSRRALSAGRHGSGRGRRRPPRDVRSPR